MAIVADNRSNILVIDDDPYFLRTIVPALQEVCAVSATTNPKEGLRRATSQPLPDLILLDVMMPGLSGYQICRELKENADTFDIPVIFVSALNQVSEKTRCFDLGAVDFVSKPVEIPVLIARVKNHIMLKLQREMLQDLASKEGAS